LKGPGSPRRTTTPCWPSSARSHPRGCLYHISGPVEGGWRVIEIWESEEAQRRFQKERLNPAFEAVGMAVVTPTYFPVHNTLPPPEAMAALAAGMGPAGS
jgi:hypothetical protein